MNPSHPSLAFLIALLLCTQALVACGDDDSDNDANNPSTTNTSTDTSGNTSDTSTGTTGETSSQSATPLCASSESPTSAVLGNVYFDTDESSHSFYKQNIGPQDIGAGGVPVRLMSSAGVAGEGVTCDNGQFAFENLSPGNYLVSVDPQSDWTCTSANCPEFVAKAVAEGSVKVVAFGDSVPVWGPAPHFPERFSDILGEFADVTLENVAVAGSRSDEWLPGNFVNHFGRNLEPALTDADLIVFSLGGNDLYALIDDLGELSPNSITPEVINQKLEEFDELLVIIQENLRAIIDEIRKINPNADIVWILYPNYAMSTIWGNLAGDLQGTAELLLSTKLENIRKNMSDVDGLILMDMFAAVEKDFIDDILLDEVHLDAQGHEFYAEELFKVIGGVRVDAQTTSSLRFGYVQP